MEDPPNDGAVLNVSKILDTVMSSAAEAELGALYINAREAVPMQHLLEEMGHKQTKIPIQTDNSTACGIVNNTIQPQQTVILLVTVLRQTGTIPILLETGNGKLGRLLDQTPLCGPPH